MKQKINIDTTTFLFLYGRYKEYLLPIGVILASILLFLVVIIPQFQNLLDSQQQAKVESGKLLVLKNNLSLLTNLDESQTDSQLQIVSRALPPDKDFGGILTAISSAANRSGVSLGDYQFQVGDISKPSLNVQSFPSLQLALTINGGMDGVLKFLTELYKSVPLSEVTSVKVNNTTSEIVVLFYFRPFPPSGRDENAPINPVSQADLSTINNLSSWNNASFVVQPAVQTSSSSSPSAGGGF